MSSPQTDAINEAILTKPNQDGNLYKCEWCTHQPYKQYASYLKHAEKCSKKYKPPLSKVKNEAPVFFSTCWTTLVSIKNPVN